MIQILFARSYKFLSVCQNSPFPLKVITIVVIFWEMAPTVYKDFYFGKQLTIFRSKVDSEPVNSCLGYSSAIKQAENQRHVSRWPHNEFFAAHVTDRVEYSAGLLGFYRYVSS